jgi:hypothetical protein
VADDLCARLGRVVDHAPDRARVEEAVPILQAERQKVHLISFPDEMSIPKVYVRIFQDYQTLPIEPIRGDKPIVVGTGTNVGGELFRDATGNIYWVQARKSYFTTPIAQMRMRAHEMQGWMTWREVEKISKIPGPPFYFPDARSDGLLMKFYGDPNVFIIENGRKRRFTDEHSFENYNKYQGVLLEYPDIISVPQEIIDAFPTGSPIRIIPTLISPPDGATLHEFPVTLTCQKHPNPTRAYHFQVASTPDFASPVYDQGGSDPTLVIESLEPGPYFWRMRGTKGGRMPSAWSEGV